MIGLKWDGVPRFDRDAREFVGFQRRHGFVVEFARARREQFAGIDVDNALNI